MGNQRRSWEKVIEAIERLHGGLLGRVYYSTSWYNNSRGSIGRGQKTAVPEWLDFDLWQGPAPRADFVDNLVHYNWHWRWRWGNGELGNNGVHGIDLCRWGLEVDHPVRVTSAGGRYRFEDDQETPDTHVVTFEFAGGKAIRWEGLSCARHSLSGEGFGVSFHGEGGALVIRGSGYKVFDASDKLVEEVSGPGGDAEHLKDFLKCVKSGARPHSDIEGAHQSTLLCHLGNIAHRTGRALSCDPKSGRIAGDAEAMKLWGREYEKGWEPKV
jgi:predicted dehydrogenase